MPPERKRRGMTRRDAIKAAVGAAVTGALGSAASAGCEPAGAQSAGAAVTSGANAPAASSNDNPRTAGAERMPVVFVGHGSPIHALAPSEWSRGFEQLAAGLPRPRAIVAISAHWFVNGTYVTGTERPRTIHDFGGFPRPLYEIEYGAPGNLDLARRVRGMLGRGVALDEEWGFDHGSWTALKWMYPEADIPVIQLSIDRRLTPQQHVELGRGLAELRGEGILILGSGNITHNLRDAFGRGLGAGGSPEWATRFDSTVSAALTQRDESALVELWPNTDDGRRAHPSPDHWFPLLYAYGATDDADEVSFPVEGFDYGSLSMRSVRFG